MTTRSLQWRYGFLLALRWLPVGLVAPVLVLVFLSRDLTLGEIGPVLAGYSLVTLAAEIPSGGLADVYGRRRVLVSSALLQLAFFAMVLSLDGVVWMTLASMIGGASRALDSGPLEAWFVDELRVLDPDADIEQRLAPGSTVNGVTLAIGAVLGGLVGSLSGGDLDRVVLAALLAQGVHVLGALFLVSESAAITRTAASTRTVFREARSVVGRNRNLRRVLAAGLGTGIALSGVEVLFQPRFDELVDGDAAAIHLGLILAASFLASAVGSAVSHRARSWSAVPVGRFLFGSACLQMVCFLGMAAAGRAWLTAAGMLVLYGLLGAMHPVVGGLLHESTPSRSRTTIVSVSSASMQSGGFVGSLTLPLLASVSSIPVAWLVAGGVIALVGVSYLGVQDRPARNLVPVGTASEAGPS